MNKNPLVFFCIFFVKAYSYLLSPIIGKNCRFFPTCSEYAIECFQNFGFIKGGWLSIKRILRCHPWGNSGYDPVFNKKELKIKEVSKVELQKFRKKFLYEGLPDDFSQYKEDNLKTTIHLALLIENEIISGLTLIKTKFNNNDALQIRGMFTIRDFCYKGYGSKLVKYVKSKFLTNNIKFLWCNSRFEAIKFYKKNGFKEIGCFFNKKQIGKHKKLFFKL